MSGRAQREHKKVEAFSIEHKEKEEFVIKAVRARALGSARAPLRSACRAAGTAGAPPGARAVGPL